MRPERTTLASWLSTYLARRLDEGHITPATHTRYEYAMRVHVLPEIGSMLLSELRREHIAELRSQWLTGEAPLAPATVKKQLGVLHQTLEEAVKNELLERNPADYVKAPPLATDAEKRALTQDEIVQLVASAADTRYDVPIRVTLALGLRRGELLGARWDDVDLDGAMLHVRQSLSYVGGEFLFVEPKSKSRRSITLSPQTVRVLHEHRAAQAELRLRSQVAWTHPELVFPSTIGTPWQPRNHLRDYRRSSSAAVWSSRRRSTGTH